MNIMNFKSIKMFSLYRLAKNIEIKLKKMLYQYEWLFIYISVGIMLSLILENFFVPNVCKFEQNQINIIENCLLAISSGLLFYWLAQTFSESTKLDFIFKDVYDTYKKHNSEYENYHTIVGMMGKQDFCKDTIRDDIFWFVKYRIYEKFSDVNDVSYYKECNELLEDVNVKNLSVKEYISLPDSRKSNIVNYILSAIFLDSLNKKKGTEL